MLDEQREQQARLLRHEHELDDITQGIEQCADWGVQAFGATALWFLDDKAAAREQAAQALAEFETSSKGFIDAATQRAGVDLRDAAGRS